MLTIIALITCVIVYYVSSRWFKGINDALNRNEVDKTNGWSLSIFAIVNVISMSLVICAATYEVSGDTEVFWIMAYLLISIIFSVSITWIWKTYKYK